LGELVSGLGASARVLVIGAHPDDEDTRLIAWLARGQHVETAYLSLTRGDGGQNLIGNELGEALGVVRTEELLAARRIDGGKQYFTRAYDFGFSKSAEEAFTHWPRDSVLNDVVTVVRAFRPHVIVSVFSGTRRDGHGQHEAAGLLAREAYDVAGDTTRFPAARFGSAWAPLKFYRSAWFRREGATLGFNVGEYNPLLGRSYAEIAAESRSQHKSQAFGTLQRKGALLDYVTREASRVDAPADPKQERSILDGIDTTWARLRPAAGAEARAALDSLPAAIAAVRRALDLFAPESAVEPLARVMGLMARVCGVESAQRCSTLPSSDLSRSLAEGARRASQAMLLAAGVAVEATSAREVVGVGARAGQEVASAGRRDSADPVATIGGGSGDTVGVMVTLYNRGRRPVTVLASSLAVLGRIVLRSGVASAPVVAPDSTHEWTTMLAGSAVSRPWWLARPRAGDMFAVPIDLRSEGERAVENSATVAVRLAGVTVDARVPVVYRYADPVRGDVSRPLAGAPAVSVTLDRAVEYAPANAPLDRAVQVHLRSASVASRDVIVRLRLPAGLSADSATRTVTLPGYDAQRTVAFRVRGKLPPGRHTIAATAASDGETFDSGYVLVDYEHIRPQRLYRSAALAVQGVELKLPQVARVGYVRGVGDNVAPALQQLGVPLVLLDPKSIATADLSAYGAIVVGPRAYEASPELVANNARLLDFTRNGGTMVVQYQQSEITQAGIAPYPMTLTRPADRVTDENAPVRVLDADAPVLNAPNRIGERDFTGWVQERALYMPRTFDQRYVPVLAMNDPGEPPNSAAILVAPYGKGTYVYTTLSFFRQLPAGNPGAARLFANLLSAGRRAPGGVRAATSAAGATVPR
jgi:LmbE family N-acetylglucosaminyl deacetylase